MTSDYHVALNQILQTYHQRPNEQLALPAPEQIPYLNFKSALRYFHSAYAENVSPASFWEYLGNKKLTDLEFANAHRLEPMGVLRVTGMEHVDFVRPAIYVSFHMGSYTSSATTLFTRNLPMALVLGEESYADKWPLFEAAAVQWRQDHPGTTAELSAINAESRSATVAMIKATKRGTNLFFYIDGNKGPTEKGAAQLTGVQVLDGAISSRRGIAYLAHLLNLPLIPVISSRSAHDQLHVDVLQPILPYGDIEAFTEQATKQVWTIFASYFARSPLQWESLIYSFQHREPLPVTAPRVFSTEQVYGFNDRRFDFFEDGAAIMFDIANQQPITIGAGYGQLLRKIQSKNMFVPGGLLLDLIKDTSVIDQLIARHILVERDALRC